VLTGIDDGAAIVHGTHEHAPISEQVSRLHELFDPWRTPPEFLTWLASWVALEIPSLQGVPLWDEYQQRKMISQIAQICRQRGVKAGLNQYLDLYAAGPTRPRVALDDGSRILSVTLRADGPATVAGLVTDGPLLNPNGSVAVEGVTRPVCLSTGGPGLFVGDAGIPAGNATPVRSRAWALGPQGQYFVTGQPRKPLAPAINFTSIVAVAVRPGSPDRLIVLDQTGGLSAIPAPYFGVAATSLGRLNVPGTTFTPVAMTTDAGGDLLVLDVGNGFGSANPPAVLTVRLDPLAVRRTALTKVVQPLSLLLEPNGSLLIGDGGPQNPSGPADYPGALWRIDRSGATWTETSLLPPGHPLVAPTGLARTPDGRLYALDAGLKPFSPTGFPDPFLLPVAVPGAVYRVDLGTPATVTRVTAPGQFVYPIGMVALGDQLVVCDPGHPLQSFRTRVRPFQFDVVVHFMTSRLPADPDVRKRVTVQAIGNVRTIIDEQRPAHTICNLVTRV
jgi:phage tail-like protein